jgi:hypothetical protein
MYECGNRKKREVEKNSACNVIFISNTYHLFTFSVVFVRLFHMDVNKVYYR